MYTSEWECRTHRIRGCDRSRKHNNIIIIPLAAGFYPTRRREIYIICAYNTHTHTVRRLARGQNAGAGEGNRGIIISSTSLLL